METQTRALDLLKTIEVIIGVLWWNTQGCEVKLKKVSEHLAWWSEEICVWDTQL